MGLNFDYHPLCSPMALALIIVHVLLHLQDNRTALMLAAAADKPKMVRILLKYKASTTATDKVTTIIYPIVLWYICLLYNCCVHVHVHVHWTCLYTGHFDFISTSTDNTTIWFTAHFHSTV